MEVDDRARSKSGVVVCLREMGDGTSRLFFDDVKANGRTNPLSWHYECFFTFTPPLPDAELEEMNLSADQFQRIGEAVVARLLAINGRVR